MGTAKAYKFAKYVAENNDKCWVLVNNKSDVRMLLAMFKALNKNKIIVARREKFNNRRTKLPVFDIKDFVEVFSGEE